MTCRPAVTLIEVLVSIFIMGVGLLALLTLFPLGALTMDQAIKADRAAALARNAYAVVSARNIRHDTALLNLNPNATPPVDVYANPNPSAAGFPSWPAINVLPGAGHTPTYPVMVDPWGVLANGSQRPVGAVANSPGLPRRSVSFVITPPAGVTSRQQALRFFSLLDDMEFSDNGVPVQVGGAVQRANRYTYALLLRRLGPDQRDWIEMAVVVYHSRPLDLPVNEPTYAPVRFDPNATSVLVEYDAAQGKPPVRKGSWVLDATIFNDAGQPDPHGYFYRVVGVTDAPVQPSGRPAVLLDLQDRPRRAATNGVLVVMEHVIEVFDEGLGWKP